MWLKQLTLLLVPFGLTQIFFWSGFDPDAEPSFGFALRKCLPVTCLALYVLLNPSWPTFEGVHRRHLRRILFGLFFSVIGDAFLVNEEKFFIAGMAAFGVAQAFYIAAFGWRPLRLDVIPRYLGNRLY